MENNLKSQKLLLIEYNGITSEKDISVSNADVYISGIIQRADFKNGNGRIYPYEVLKKAVDKYLELVKESRAAGEADHPTTTEVSIKNISHIITDIWWEGKYLYGRMKLTTNTVGKDVRALILNDGFKMGISSRGFGSVTKKGDDIIVNEDFEIVCFDLVHDPSTAGAYVLKEGKFVKVSNDEIFQESNSIIMKKKDNSINSILDTILSIKV